jgi:hypothetical protein
MTPASTMSFELSPLRTSSTKRSKSLSIHGVFAPRHALRAAITPAGRGRGARPPETAERPVPKHVAMSWAQRLERVFAIDIERCRRCGGKLRVSASIEDPARIKRILAHLELPAGDPPCAPFNPRAPPQPLPLC